MLTLYYIVLVLGAIGLFLFLKFRIKEINVKSLMFKTFTSVMFILSGLFAAELKPSYYSAFICAGLVLGLLGDIWLDMKFMYKKDEKFLTNAGFISFMFGHFFYIAAIVVGTIRKFEPVSILPALGVGLFAAAAVFFGEKIMKLDYGSFKIISTDYGAVLFFVTAFAFSSAVFSGIENNKHLVAFSIGGVLFAISDLILSGTYFGKGKDRPVDIITNHVTYYLAQFVIASSILFI